MMQTFRTWLQIFWVFLLVATVADTAVHQMKLGYMPPVKERLLKQGKLEEYLALREAIGTVKMTASQPVIDYQDMAYFAFITLGTPGQPFKAFLDTGSSTLWMPDSSCLNGTQEECGDFCQMVPAETCTEFCLPKCCQPNSEKVVIRQNAGGCSSKNHFNSDDSSTYKKDGSGFSITYQTGTVTGFLGVDTICMSGTDLCIADQTFGQVTTIGGGFVTQPIDGILGLAFPALAYNHITPPVFNAVNQGLLDQPIFTVYMSRSGPTVLEHGGMVTYGGLDAANCASQVDYVNLVSTTYFMFQMSGVAAGSYSLQGKSWNSVSITSAAYIGGPTAVVEKLAAEVGATYNEQYSSYFIDCEARSSDIVFTINGKNYNITPGNYIISVGSGPCMFAFFGTDAGGFMPSWLLGPPFIREYCQVYDITSGSERVGFAKALTH